MPDYDVVVVGGGGAGLAAASMAASLGRRVALLEKNEAIGGTTAYSVGSVSATSTPHQLRVGILDSPEDHWRDLQLFGGTEAPLDNTELGRVLADGTPEMFRWLLAAGLEFIGPMPEPPHRRPRMHNVVPNSRAFPYHLGRLCTRQGVGIFTTQTAERVIFDAGRAVAVETVDPLGKYTRWNARGGVVLAAGDFSASTELKAHFASALAAGADPVNPGSTGDGIRMGLAAGGEVLNGAHLRGPFLRFIPPRDPGWIAKLPPLRPLTRTMAWAYGTLPSTWLRPFLMKFLTTTLAPDKALFTAGAALIDRDGALIRDSRGNPHHATARAPGGLGFIVFDHRIARQFSAWPYFVSTAPGVAYAYLDDYRRTRRDICYRAASLKELAAQLGMPEDAFELSVQEHNAAIAAHPGAAQPIVTAPYHALGPAKAYVVFTNGGLKVSPRLEVLRADGSSISGLYAAGSNGQGGQLLEGHGHHLGWAFVSGRVAGRNAALAATTPGSSSVDPKAR